MSITKKQYNNLQLPYKQQQTIATGDIAGIDFGYDDANSSLQDWSGREIFSVSFERSTGSEEYNREVEIDSTWAKIAQLSIERWSKENPY